MEMDKRRMLGIMLVVVVGMGMSVVCMGACSKTLGDTTFEKCSFFAGLDSTLSWTYYPGNGSLSFGFKAKPPEKGGWVGWGINPTMSGMIGTQALIGFQQADGKLVTMAYNVNTASGDIAPSAISYPATNLRSTFESGSITVFATILLPSNKTQVNHTWQVGPGVDGLKIKQHSLLPNNRDSYGPLNLLSPATTSVGSPSSSPAPGVGGGSGSPPIEGASPTGGSTPTGGTTTSSSSSSYSSCKANFALLSILILSLSMFGR